MVILLKALNVILYCKQAQMSVLNLKYEILQYACDKEH